MEWKSGYNNQTHALSHPLISASAPFVHPSSNYRSTFNAPPNYLSTCGMNDGKKERGNREIIALIIAGSVFNHETGLRSRQSCSPTCIASIGRRFTLTLCGRTSSSRCHRWSGAIIPSESQGRSVRRFSESIPSNDGHAQDTAEAAEYQSDDPTGGESVASHKLAFIIGRTSTFPREGKKDTHPPGSGRGGAFCPVRSKKSKVLAAALPFMGTPPDLQASKWLSGMVKVFCNSSGASTNVATSPLWTCHSRWQWNSQIPGRRTLVY